VLAFDFSTWPNSSAIIFSLYKQNTIKAFMGEILYNFSVAVVDVVLFFS
jgi:hypothetical protein